MLSQTFEYSVFIKLQIFADVDPDLASFNCFVMLNANDDWGAKYDQNCKCEAVDIDLHLSK